MSFIKSTIAAFKYPKTFMKWLRAFHAFSSGLNWSSSLEKMKVPNENFSTIQSHEINELRKFFDQRTVGRGIWKWLHYFEVYDFHLKKFRGKNVNLLEIGIYSGGSLEMWRNYFGENCKIIGVDIEEACNLYKNNYTEVVIGDQEDRLFWKSFRGKFPPLDIVIDDGGHESNQQRVTFEEVFTHIKPGGVFICEDIHHLFNDYTFHAFAVAMNLNGMKKEIQVEGVVSNQIQSQIKSIHFYPFMVVVEKNYLPVNTLVAPRHGTEWQPFL